VPFELKHYTAYTFLGPNTAVCANALSSGNAGRVVVWADKVTWFQGRVEARGGPQAGDGGFVEVSGRKHLAFDGQVDVTATRGTAGSLLLDPRDVIIANGTIVGDDVELIDGVIRFTDGSATTDFMISETALEDLTGNVVIRAQRDVILRDLTDDGRLDMANLTAGGSLTLQAGRHITFENAANTVATAGAAVHLEADSPASPVGAADGTGTVTLGHLSTAGGDVTLVAADLALDGSINADGAGTSGRVVIRPATAVDGGRGIDLGTDAAGSLGIADAELDRITTAGVVQIGDALTGQIELSTNVDPANFDTLHLVSSEEIANTNQTNTIAVEHLAMTADHAIGVSGTPIRTEVSDLSAVLTDPAATGDVFILERGGLRVATVDGQSGVSTTADGHVWLQAEAGTLDVSQSIAAAGAGNVTLTAKGALSDFALNADVRTGSGEIFITAGRSIVADGSGRIAATVDGTGSLGLYAVDAVGTLAQPIDVDVAVLAARIAGTTTAGDIHLNQVDGVQGDLTIGTAGGLRGITTRNDNDATVVTQGGTLTVRQNVSANGAGYVSLTAGGSASDLVTLGSFGDVLSGSGTIAMTAGRAIRIGDRVETFGGNVTLTTGTGDTGRLTLTGSGGAADAGRILSGGGAIEINADDLVIDVATTALIDAGNGRVTIRPADQADGARAIDLGSDTPGRLAITDAELDRVVTGDVVQIGDRFAGDVTLSADMTPMFLDTLRIDSSGSLDTTAAGNTIVVENLALEVDNSIGSAAARVSIDATSLAARSNVAGDIFLADVGAGLTVGTVDGLSGITTTASDVGLTVDGNLTVAQPITAGGSGRITLTATGGGSIHVGANLTGVGSNSTIAVDADDAITQTDGTLIAGGSLRLTAGRGIGVIGERLLTDVSNLSAVLDAPAATGDIFVVEQDALTITEVDGQSGIATTNGRSVDLQTLDGTLTVARPVVADGAGEVSLVAKGITSDVEIRAHVSTATGEIFLAAGQSITAPAAGVLTATTPGSGRLAIYAVEAIGTAADPVEIDVALLAARLAGPASGGDMFLEQIDGVQHDLTIAKVGGLTGITTTNDNDATVVARAGTITVDEAVSADGSGKATLRAEGPESDVAINALVTTETGAVDVLAADDVSFSAAGRIWAPTTATVRVEADLDAGVAADLGGLIHMADGSLIDAGDGTIDLRADGDVTLAGVTTTGTGNATLSITSTSGGLIDGGDAAVDVDAPNGTLVADTATGIGSLDPIETHVAALDVDNVGGGDVRVVEADGVTVVRAVQAAGGNVELVANGTITVDAPGTATAISAAGAGSVTLNANGPAANIVVSDGVQTDGGQVLLRADNDVAFQTDGRIDSLTGPIVVTADADGSGGGAGGSLLMDESAAVDADSGPIALSADGEIRIGRLVTANGTPAAVSVVSANGDVSDAGDTPGVVNVEATAGTATLNAPNGSIGRSTGGALETAVATLIADAGGTAGLDVENATSLTATLTANTGTAKLAVIGAGNTLETGGVWSADAFDADAEGAVTVRHAIAADTPAGIDLRTHGATDAHVTLGGPLTAVGGTVTLVSAGEIIDGNDAAAVPTNNVTAEDLVMAAAAGIGISGHGRLETSVTRLEADGGSGGLVLDNAGGLTIGGITTGGVPLTGISANGAAIDVAATGDLAIVEQISTPAGIVTLDSTGSIVDANGPADDVTAGSLLLKAAGSVGVYDVAPVNPAHDPLETRVATLAIEAGSGPADHVILRNTGDLRLDAVDGVASVSTAGGNIDVEVLSGTLTIAGSGGPGAITRVFSGRGPGGAVGGSPGGDVRLASSGNLLVEPFAIVSTRGGSGGSAFQHGAELRGMLDVGQGQIVLRGGNPDTLVTADQTIAGNYTLSADRDVIVSADVTTAANAAVPGHIEAVAGRDVRVGQGATPGSLETTNANADVKLTAVRDVVVDGHVVSARAIAADASALIGGNGILAGNSAKLTAQTGIGLPGTPLKLDVATLSSATSATGGIAIDLQDADNGGVTVDRVDATVSGDVWLSGRVGFGTRMFTLVDTNNGAVDVRSDAGDLALGLIAAGTGGTLDRINATAAAGQLLDAAPTNDVADLIGDVATLAARDGIGLGPGGSLDLDVNRLDSAASRDGGIALNLLGTHDVTVASADAAATGDVRLTATGGSGLRTYELVDTHTGNIDVNSSVGDVAVGLLTAGTGGVARNVSVTAAGAILDADPANNEADVVGNEARLSAATGIGPGVGGSLDLNVNRLVSAASPHGGVAVNLLGEAAGPNGLIADHSVVVDLIDASASGNVTLTATAGAGTRTYRLVDTHQGGIDVGSTAGNLALGLLTAGTGGVPGAIAVHADGGQIVDADGPDDAADAIGDSASLSAALGIGQTAAGSLDVNVNRLTTVTSQDGGIAVNLLGSPAAANGLAADHAVVVDLLDATNTGDVVLTGTSGGGLRTFTLVDTHAGSIDVLSTAGDLALGLLTAGTGGVAANVSVTAEAGRILDDTNDAAADVVGNETMLSATLGVGGGPGGTLDVNVNRIASAVSREGGIALNVLNTAAAPNGLAADRPVTVALVDATVSGDVTLTGTSGAGLRTFQLVDTHAGTIDVSSAGGDVALGLLTAGTGGVAANVSVKAEGGRIIDANATTGDDVRGAGAVLAAAFGVGAPGPAATIETRLANLEADGGSGGVFVENTGDLTVGNVDPATQGIRTDAAVDVHATGSLTIAETVTAASATGAVNLAADDDVTFTTTGRIVSTLGPVIVRADADGGADGSSGALTMLNGASIATAGPGIELTADEDVTVANLSAPGALSVTSGNGAITNASTATVEIGGTATLRSAGGITLGVGGAADAIAFGSLVVQSTDVVIVEDSSTLLDGVDADDFSLDSAGAITDSAVVEVAGLAAFNAGANPITLGDLPGETTNFGRLALVGGDVAVTEDSDTLLVAADVGTLQLASAGNLVTDEGPIRATGTVQLDAVGNVEIRNVASLPPGTSELTTGTLLADAGATFVIENHAVLESLTGKASNAPPLLRIDEANPGKVIVPGDRVQELAGTVGGIESEGDNLEQGANFTVIVVWDDGITSIITGLHAGAAATLHVAEDGSGTPTITPGGSTGPATLEITRNYPVDHLITVVSEVTATVEVLNDARIALDDVRAVNLNAVDSSVTTRVSGEQFGGVGIPMKADETPEIIIPEPIVVPPPTRAALPQPPAQLEYLRPPSETVAEEERLLYIVRVGPDGQEGTRHELPEDAMADTKALFERFRRKGLPNGLYRIYLKEVGFPRRLLMEFYKSGDTFGDPIREPGRGSNPVIPDAAPESPLPAVDDSSDNSGGNSSGDSGGDSGGDSPHATPDAGRPPLSRRMVVAGGSLRDTVWGMLERAEEQIVSKPDAPPAESPGETPRAADEQTGDASDTAAQDYPALTAATVAGGGLVAGLAWGRWKRSVDGAMEDAHHRSFTKAARLRRRLRR